MTNSEIIAKIEKNSNWELSDDCKSEISEALNKARASDLQSNHENPKDFQAFSAELKNSRDEAIEDFYANWGMYESSLKQRILEDETLKDALENLYEAGKQSALAEIDKLKQQLSEKAKELSNELELKKRFAIRCDALELELSQFRDGVGKLKTHMFDFRQCNGQKECEEFIDKYIKSCAEQPNIEELIGYECKTCNAKVAGHGCADHREATGHNEFKSIYAKPKKDIQNKPISSDQTKQSVCKHCGKPKGEHFGAMLWCKEKFYDERRFESKTEPKKSCESTDSQAFEHSSK